MGGRHRGQNWTEFRKSVKRSLGPFHLLTISRRSFVLLQLTVYFVGISLLLAGAFGIFHVFGLTVIGLALILVPPLTFTFGGQRVLSEIPVLISEMIPLIIINSL